MKQIKSIVSIIGIVVKYGAVVMAIVKGLSVMYEELQNIEISTDTKKEQ
jgi:hypothetical protein